MATFEQIKAKIGDWLAANATRIPDTVRGDIINLQQKELLRLNDLRFGQASDSFATVVSQYNYTLPTGWSRPELISYLGSTGDFNPIRPIAKTDLFRQRFPDQTKTGTPTHFHIRGNEIWLGPTPNAILTFNRDYYRTLPDLSDGAPNNDNAFTQNAWEVLMWGALAFATTYMIEDDRAPVFQANFERTKAQLLIEQARAEYSADDLVTEEQG